MDSGEDDDDGDEEKVSRRVSSWWTCMLHGLPTYNHKGTLHSPMDMDVMMLCSWTVVSEETKSVATSVSSSSSCCNTVLCSDVVYGGYIASDADH